MGRTGRWGGATAPLLAAVLACSPADRAEPPSGAPATAVPDAPVATAAQDAARDAFVRDGLALPGATGAALREALGPPLSVARTAVPNRHVPGATDTIVVLTWPDLVATFHHAGGSAFLSEIEVADDRFLADAGVRIGMPWREVRRRLGPTAAEAPFAYDCRSCMGAGSPVVFVVEDGVVRRVRFTYYVD